MKKNHNTIMAKLEGDEQAFPLFQVQGNCLVLVDKNTMCVDGVPVVSWAEITMPWHAFFYYAHNKVRFFDHIVPLD